MLLLRHMSATFGISFCSLLLFLFCFYSASAFHYVIRALVSEWYWILYIVTVLHSKLQ